MKKVKDYIKKNPEPAKGRFGVDPHDPWSTKYNVAEDLTTKEKGSGDSRSKVSDSPTQQRANKLDKAAKYHQIKNPTGTMGSKVHHEEKHMNKKEGNQNTALTPESVQKCNESPVGKMCEVHGMKACTMNEAQSKRMSGADKFRKFMANRDKQHTEFMKGIEGKSHAEKMQAMMDKIKSNLNKEEFDLEEAKHYPYKFRATYHDPDTNEVTHYMDFTHRNLEAAKKHAKNSVLQRKDGKEDKLHSVVQMKEEVEQIDELNYDTIKSYYKKRRDDYRYGDDVGFKKKGKKVSAKNVSAANSRLMGYKPTQNQPQKEEVRGELKHIRKKETKMYNKEIEGFNKKVKEIHAEEVVNEVSTKKLLGYMMKAGSKKDPKKDTKDRSSNVMKATGKYLEKEEISQVRVNKFHKKLDKLVHNSFGKSSDEKKMKEETYHDAKAATPAVMSPGEGISEKKSTLQRVMSLKKKTVKEDMYDHEKEDKSVATYGKKPKFDKAEKDEGGENKPSAAAVMTGGTTLTGSKRDIVEIDPMMRNRPGQPDVTKKDDKKDDKDKDKKKDK